MEETYTFSRALHMMRYGGKKMGRARDNTQEYFCVEKENLLRAIKVNGKWTNPTPTNGVPSWMIMGSWVEVKE